MIVAILLPDKLIILFKEKSEIIRTSVKKPDIRRSGNRVTANYRPRFRIPLSPPNETPERLEIGRFGVFCCPAKLHCIDFAMKI